MSKSTAGRNYWAGRLFYSQNISLWWWGGSCSPCMFHLLVWWIHALSSGMKEQCLLLVSGKPHILRLGLQIVFYDLRSKSSMTLRGVWGTFKWNYKTENMTNKSWNNRPVKMVEKNCWEEWRKQKILDDFITHFIMHLQVMLKNNSKLLQNLN